MASSKLSGKSETGFAFGLRPPMATGVEHSLPHILAADAVYAAWSAAWQIIASGRADHGSSNRSHPIRVEGKDILTSYSITIIRCK